MCGIDESIIMYTTKIEYGVKITIIVSTTTTNQHEIKSFAMHYAHLR